MKKEDVMPGGKLFPAFWIGVFVILFVASLSCLVVSGIFWKKDEKLYQRYESPKVTAPAVTEVVEITSKPEETPVIPDKVVSGELIYIPNIQKEVLDLFFDAKTKYGMRYRDGDLTSDGFADAFFDGAGYTISESEVMIGDYAIGNGISGICVGMHYGVPVYAYMSRYTAAGPDDNGMCLGYSKRKRDELFYGMYPVKFTAFYRGCTGDDNVDYFSERIERLQEPAWYVTEVFKYGKGMSAVDVDFLLGFIMEDKLTVRNKRMHPPRFEEWLKNLPESQGFSGTYDLMVDSVKKKSTYTEVTVKFIPHEAAGISPTGEWKITLYEKEGKFIPSGIKFADHMDVGFVKDNDITINTDKDGNVTVEKEEIIYGQTVDENGRPILRLENGTIIYLD